MSVVQRLFSPTTVVCIGAVWLVLNLAAPAFAAGPEDPILNLRSGLIEQAKAGWPPSGPPLEALIDQDFDMPAITRAVLGDQAAAATPAQTARLSHALVLKLEQQIGRMRPPAANDGFTVVGVRPTTAGAMLVTTRTNPPASGGAAAQPAISVWRVRPSGGRPRILDIVRQGVSTVQLQHDDFAGALRGRDLDTVIALFESRAAAKPAQW